MKKILITMLITILMTSCGVKGETTGTQSVQVKTTNGTASKFEERKVETEVNNGELTIANKVKIKQGASSDFPSDFPIINGGKIYQNSNMQKYAFIIEENKSLKEIYEYYKKEMEKKGYTDKTVLSKETKLEELSVINMTLENQKEKLTIFINKEVPLVLKESLGLEGNFIEIQYTEKTN